VRNQSIKAIKKFTTALHGVSNGEHKI